MKSGGESLKAGSRLESSFVTEEENHRVPWRLESQESQWLSGRELALGWRVRGSIPRDCMSFWRRERDWRKRG